MLLGVRTSCASITMLVALSASVLPADGLSAQESASGHWAATLSTAEHHIMFDLEIPEQAPSTARISMGFPCTATAKCEGNAEEVTLTFPRNESRIVATRVGDALYGEWRRERVVDGQTIVERLPLEARRLSGAGCGGVLEEVAPLPTRWASEADECGSAATYTVDTDRFGRLLVRTVGPDGRVVNHSGLWSPKEGTLSLTRFDGVEAQVIEATRQPDGSFEGRVWTGPNMPERWVIRPVHVTPKTDAPVAGPARSPN